MPSILLFSPVAVVKLIVGRLSVGICGEGGLKLVGTCCGGSNRPEAVSGRCCTFGCELVKGMLNLGRNLLLISLISREVMLIGSFSERTSMVVVEEGGEEAKGLSVRSGMVLVVE